MTFFRKFNKFILKLLLTINNLQLLVTFCRPSWWNTTSCSTTITFPVIWTILEIAVHCWKTIIFSAWVTLFQNDAWSPKTRMVYSIVKTVKRLHKPFLQKTLVWQTDTQTAMRVRNSHSSFVTFVSIAYRWMGWADSISCKPTNAQVYWITASVERDVARYRPMAGISICSNGGGRNAAMFHLLEGPLANMKSPGLHQ